MMDSLAHIICTKGQYFNPAIKHYGYKGIVICDICGKFNLKTCVGYNQHDMCLKCVDDHMNIQNNNNSTELYNLINKYIMKYWNHIASDELRDYIYEVISSDKFKSNKSGYLNSWVTERGLTQELRIPEDPARDIIDRMFNDLVI